MAAAACSSSLLRSEEAEGEGDSSPPLVPPGLHTKFNHSGLEFLKASFLRHVHEILEKGIPDGERDVSDALRFSWSDLNCPQLEERDPILEIVPGEGMKGRIVIDDFSIDGKWGYAYKKGLFKWSDTGTFHLAFKRLTVNIIMSIKIEGPERQLKMFIRPGNAAVEAEDVDIKMKSQGVMTQGIINVALPHIRTMWRKPEELSKKIEETANMNLKEVVRLLPVSYPLRRPVLGVSFHVGNLFQSDFEITAEYCYWELSSVIVPTSRYVDYLARQKEKEMKGAKTRFQKKKVEVKSDEENHPFSADNFPFPRPEVPNMARLPATKGVDNHISYCLSEFTLNTFASSLFELGLCEALVEDWEKLPGYLQRYISTLCREEATSVRVEAKLTHQPKVIIGSQGMELGLEGWIVMAGDREPLPDGASAPFKDDAEEAEDESRGWNFFHKTSHELRLRVTPRVDKDFVAKFSFEKISCTSEFERTVIKRKCAKNAARCTMLEIVENIIIVELMPRLFEIGEVGIPLTINEGCLFEASDILYHSNALVITGFMRLKEFIGALSNVSNDDDDAGNNAAGPEAGPGTAAVAEMAAEAADAAAAALAEAAAAASAAAAAALERELERDGESK